MSTERSDAHALISFRVRLFSVWSWLIALVVFAFGFVVLAGFIPPPQEDWSASRLAAFYEENRTGIRAGIIVAMFGSAFMMPFFTAISHEIRRIEGPGAGILAQVQFAGAVILIAFFQIICLGWLLASLRPEISPEITRAIHDYGWLVWTILIPTYSMQFVCMAVAGFMDQRERPLWPRSAAYVNLWCALTGAGGVLAVFFKNGPFSWNGVLGFWIPVIAFVLAMTMTMVLMRKRVLAERPAGATPVLQPDDEAPEAQARREPLGAGV